MSDVDTMLFYTVKELDSHAKHGQSLKKNYEHFSQKSAHTQQPEREQEHAHQCGSFRLQKSLAALHRTCLRKISPNKCFWKCGSSLFFGGSNGVFQVRLFPSFQR